MSASKEAAEDMDGNYPPGASSCLFCGETLVWWGDGYGHARGWCKGHIEGREGDGTVAQDSIPDLRPELRWIENTPSKPKEAEP